MRMGAPCLYNSTSIHDPTTEGPVKFDRHFPSVTNTHSPLLCTHNTSMRVATGLRLLSQGLCPERHCRCYERPHSLCTSADWMHAAMGPAVHAGFGDIKCVRVPHAVNPICLAGRRSGGFPSNFCLARGPVAGAKFLLTRVATSHTHLTA
jgi:hypothetical protein